MADSLSSPTAISAPTQTSDRVLPTTRVGVLMMFVSNMFNMSIFMGANLSMVLCSSVLQQIWDRNFGKSKDPGLFYIASFLSVMAFSFGTMVTWCDPNGAKGSRSPAFLLAMGWTFSFVGATLFATLFVALAAESIISPS